MDAMGLFAINSLSLLSGTSVVIFHQSQQQEKSIAGFLIFSLYCLFDLTSDCKEFLNEHAA